MTGAPDTDLPVSEQQQRDGEPGSKMSLWIGQRGDQHFLFKVSTNIDTLIELDLKFYKNYREPCKMSGWLLVATDT